MRKKDSIKLMMMRLCRIIFFLLILNSILLLINTPLNFQAYAQDTLLNEDFNDGVADGWIEKADWGSWSVINGEYVGTVTLKKYPEIPSISYFPSLNKNNYIFEADIKGTEGVDKCLRFRFNQSTDTYYAINLRSKYTAGGGGGNDLVFGKVLSGSIVKLEKLPYENFRNTWYRIKIIAEDEKIKIFINNVLQLNLKDIENPILSGTIAFVIWPGGHTDSVIGNVTTTHYDNVLISSITKPPLIFLPGMIACWNNALLTGTDAENWHLWSLANVFAYRNLITSLNNSGLKENEDWYLFCYDWRKPLSYNAEKLNSFIQNQVNTPENNRLPTDQVNLVGHSMGGLVSRAFTQSYPDIVNKLITIGSPHEGAVKAYPAWEAGQTWDEELLRKFLFWLVVTIHHQPQEQLMNTMRRIIPSIKDLLPTFDFLVDNRTNQLKDINTHIHKNTTMTSLNSSLSDGVKAKMKTISGKSYDTLDQLKVYSISTPIANWVHQIFGFWEDGEPIHTCTSVICEYTDHIKDYSSAKIFTTQGDGTVLLKSASISGVPNYEISTTHDKLVMTEEPLKQLFGLLGIEGTPDSSPFKKLNKIFGFLLRSPAKITVTAPDGKQAGYLASDPQIENNFYDDGVNFLLIPNPLEGKYQVKIIGTGEGTYHLLATSADEENQPQFYEYLFPTYPGKEDNFIINLAQPNIFLEDKTGSIHLESLKTKIEEIKGEIEGKCNLDQSLFLLNKAKGLIIKGKYQPASNLIKESLAFVNKCLFRQSDDRLLELIPKLESAFDDFREIYLICVRNGNLSFQPQEIQSHLKSKARTLEQLNQNFQLLADSGKVIPPVKALLFEKAADLMLKAQIALNNNELAKADILEFQLDFYLTELSS